MICVYKITSPSGKIYVGSTVNFKTRMSSYRRMDCTAQPRLLASLLKYGFQNHIVEILCECERQDMRRLEREYGILFNVLGDNGLTCVLPKVGEIAMERRPETLLKMGESRKGKPSPMKGKKYSEEDRKRIHGNREKRTHTEETKALIRQIQLEGKYNKGGYKLSDEFKKKVSERTKGNKYALGTKQSEENNLKKSINMKETKRYEEAFEGRNSLVLNLEDGIFYDSMKEAYRTYPALNKRWKYKYMTNMLSGYKHNKTPLIYIEDEATISENLESRLKIPRETKKATFNTELGIIYDSAIDAFNSLIFPFKYKYFRRMLSGDRPNKTQFIYI